MPTLISILRAAICQNQGEYLNYSHRAHQLHRTMRIAYDSDEPVHTLHDHLLTLVRFLENALDSAIQNNFVFLETIFHVIRPYSVVPRICVKANKKESHTPLIFDLSRHYAHDKRDPSPIKTYINEPFAVTQNTGFEHVAKTHTHFLEQNIPQAVLSGYKNPRLDNDKARRYKRPSLLKRLFLHRDLAWEQCWKGYDNPAAQMMPSEACYKSTLIVPVGLSKGQLGEELLRTIHQTFPHASNLESIIFSYLCFDHTSTYYFDDPLHVDVGVVFADILSLYFFRRWTLTVASHTYREARKRVAQSQTHKEEKKWRTVP